MMRALSRLTVVLAAMSALADPAAADSSLVQLTGTWQKIASAGYVSVDVQVLSGQVILATATNNPASGQPANPAPLASANGQRMSLDEHRCFALFNSDLYGKGAPAATIAVLDGLSCAGRGF